MDDGWGGLSIEYATMIAIDQIEIANEICQRGWAALSNINVSEGIGG